MKHSASPIRVNALHDLVSSTVTEWQVPGIVAAVVNADSVLASASAGVANLDTGTPLSSDSPFQIGSISKSFTAIAITQLEHEGRLRVDEEVRDFLPWFQLPSSRPITIRHLLHHTSGMPTGTDTNPDAQAQALALVERQVFCEAGRFHYSNLGYAILGLVIEEITGHSLPSVLDERVITPLAMTSSAASVAASGYARLVPGYVPLSPERPYAPGDPLARAAWFEAESADGSIVSTAPDLARYTRMLLARGRLDDVELVTPEGFERLLATVPTADGDASAGTGYGRGLFIRQHEHGPVLWHSGSMVGYTSHLIADIQHDVGVVVLANISGGSRAASFLAERIHAVSLGQDADAAIRQLRRSAVEESSIPTGRFGHASPLTVSAGQHATIDYGGVRGSLFRTAPGAYATDHPSFQHAYLRTDRHGGADCWVYGPFAFPHIDPAQETFASEAASEDFAPFEGTYRSYSPWYPSIEIYSRFGTLRVASGVDEVELTNVSSRVYRPSDEASAAERFIFGPLIDGLAAWIEWDGLRFSRRFDNQLSWLD